SEPDILIADEPTGALDQTTGEDVMDLLININKKGKTVIIVTHDEKIAAYCNRKINILDGKIVSDTQNKAV
ncbi:MAG: ABC transporter ATP-binding protein, partial [Clostridiaceae bacterium]